MKETIKLNVIDRKRVEVVEVELIIDRTGLAQLLSERAFKSKSRKATALHGLITLRAPK